MLFILWKGQRGCERGLWGIQRLLCTLLCTRSNPLTSPDPPCAGPEVKPHVWLPPLMIASPLLQKRTGPLGVIRGANRLASFGRGIWRNAENVCPVFCLKANTRSPTSMMLHLGRWPLRRHLTYRVGATSLGISASCAHLSLTRRTQ